jgi:prepilin-type N-terminal cleavage/methylation domain-containing protein
MKTTSSNSKGFTLIELMISMAVFTAILAVVLAAVMQISRMYYKGITTSKTQAAARAILDRISQQIQYSAVEPLQYSFTPATSYVFSTADNNTPPQVFCIGKNRYTLRYNKQVADQPNSAINQQLHGLWSDIAGSTAECDPSYTPQANLNASVPSANAGGAELVPNNMRIVDLSIVSNLWSVKVKVVYGDQDLLDTVSGATSQESDIQNTVCKGSEIGSEFCSISSLETIVQRRVQ